jgi:hypothetical protein
MASSLQPSASRSATSASSSCPAATCASPRRRASAGRRAARGASPRCAMLTCARCVVVCVVAWRGVVRRGVVWVVCGVAWCGVVCVRGALTPWWACAQRAANNAGSNAPLSPGLRPPSARTSSWSVSTALLHCWLPWYSSDRPCHAAAALSLSAVARWYASSDCACARACVCVCVVWREHWHEAVCACVCTPTKWWRAVQCVCGGGWHVLSTTARATHTRRHRLPPVAPCHTRTGGRRPCQCTCVNGQEACAHTSNARTRSAWAISASSLGLATCARGAWGHGRVAHCRRTCCQRAIHPTMGASIQAAATHTYAS